MIFLLVARTLLVIIWRCKTFETEEEEQDKWNIGHSPVDMSHRVRDAQRLKIKKNKQKEKI